MPKTAIRRQAKNVAVTISDAPFKVREATSDDPTGPSTGLMNEIADLSNDPAAFTEIMSIIWKRLNDHDHNWRQVYNTLILLDFLIKSGSEKVAQNCRENIYSIETLRDCQNVEEGRNKGPNVREKAKQMAALLTDEERLKNERARFMLTSNRFEPSSCFGPKTRSATFAALAELPPGECDDARPDSLGEEEEQMQVAIALSKEEKREEEKMKLNRAALERLLSLLGQSTEADPMAISTSISASSTFNDLWNPAPLTLALPPLYPPVPTTADPWSDIIEYMPFASLSAASMYPTNGH
ncbi:hypothetical protein PFISCL1PPCAC_27770, partial [Pristionchus fissidentatus]